MIQLQDIAYVRSGTADLATAVGFATDIVGLELVAQAEGRAWLRAEERHHCLAFIEGESGVLSTGFTVADEAALADAERALDAAGVKVVRGSAAGAYERR
ncbi:VOC family protein, partial [Clavibacter michiganensis]|uniref:VOC family protein n=1 Tax=Clavibacter michiganensis TaxID=28447 RepID=UPI00292CA735